jgi:hypothetical protein
MKKLLMGGLLALVAAALIVTVAPAHNGKNGRHLAAHLDGYQEVPAISTTGRGKFKIKVNGDSAEFKLRYSGLSSPVKFAHVHFGREGVNGGVIAFLCGGGGKPACPASGEVTGTILPADVVGPVDQGIAAGEFGEFVAALKADAVYANVHTDNFGNGEIRGQVDGHRHHHGFGKFGNGGKEHDRD